MNLLTFVFGVGVGLGISQNFQHKIVHTNKEPKFVLSYPTSIKTK